MGEGDSLQQIRNYSDTSSFTYSPNSAGSSTKDLFGSCPEGIFFNASLPHVLFFLQLLSLLAQFFGGTYDILGSVLKDRDSAHELLD